MPTVQQCEEIGLALGAGGNQLEIDDAAANREVPPQLSLGVSWLASS
jgi:hypothetical protein